MAESILQQQLKYFSDNQSGPRFTIIHGNRLKGYEPFNRDYEVESYCPELLLFGSSGGGEAYAFDKRSLPWRVVEVPFVGMDYSLCKEIGGSFSEFIEALFKKEVNS